MPRKANGLSLAALTNSPAILQTQKLLSPDLRNQDTAAQSLLPGWLYYHGILSRRSTLTLLALQWVLCWHSLVCCTLLQNQLEEVSFYSKFFSYWFSIFHPPLPTTHVSCSQLILRVYCTNACCPTDHRRLHSRCHPTKSYSQLDRTSRRRRHPNQQFCYPSCLYRPIVHSQTQLRSLLDCTFWLIPFTRLR